MNHDLTVPGVVRIQPVDGCEVTIVKTGSRWHWRVEHRDPHDFGDHGVSATLATALERCFVAFEWLDVPRAHAEMEAIEREEFDAHWANEKSWPRDCRVKQ